MLTNLFLFIALLIILLFIASMWLRQGLLHRLRNVRAQRAVLQHDLDKRRDTVPYLLETYRIEQETDAKWHQLLMERSFFHTQESMEREQVFEEILMQFSREAKVKNIQFLEAKKDIQDLSELIQKEKMYLEQHITLFNETQKQFPYSLASAIFGFKPFSL